MGGHSKHLFPHALAGSKDGSPTGYRASARPSSPTIGSRAGITLNESHIGDFTAELIRNELCIDGIVALAVGVGTDGEYNSAIGIDTNMRRFEAGDTGHTHCMPCFGPEAGRL